MRKLTHNSSESEKAIDAYLCAQVIMLGGIALKYSGAVSGYPDRICMLPGGIMIWVEVKSKGCKPRPLQLHRHQQLQAIGQHVFVVASKDDVNNILKKFIK